MSARTDHHSRPIATATTAASGTEGRILLVDDDESALNQLIELLHLDFPEIRGVTDPREVEGLLDSYRPDLILLDLKMPHLSGFDILEMIRATLPAGAFLPVIVLTGDTSEEAHRRALRLGAMDFLAKPFRYEEAVLRVRNHLHASRLHKQLEEQNRMLDNKVSERSAALHWTEGQLRASEDKLGNQVRLNAMGAMAAGVAHDFNNSVSVIKGHSEMMVTCPDLRQDPEQVAHAFTVIKNAADDATSVVRRLREFYRPLSEWEENGIGDLRAVCKEVIPLTMPKWKSQAQVAGRQIRMVTDLEAIYVQMPSAKLREILTNLIFNAVDALPDGGTITLRSRRVDKSGVLEVIDDGIGMTDEVRRQCLDPFFSTKGQDGTGLGLGMVADLVQRCHGQLEIITGIDTGTSIRITLPEAVDTESLWDPENEEVLDRRLHVLLVDDEENVRLVLQAALERDGHTVADAADGREAMALFHREYFDLVITDCAMPHINGVQLAAAIRRHAPNKPIVMLSGFTDRVLGESGPTVEVNCMIDKPIGLKTLRQTLLKLFPPSRPVSLAGEGSAENARYPAIGGTPK